MDTQTTDTVASGAGDIAQLPGAIKAALAAADSNTIDSLGALARVQQARLARETRAVRTLTAEYGAEDERVIEAAAAVNATNATIARLALVTRDITVPTVTVSQNGWALHGRVVQADLSPAARFTVFLVDAMKSYQRQYGFAYTDDTGYFLIHYGESKADNNDTRDGATEKSETGDEAKRNAAAEAARATGTSSVDTAASSSTNQPETQIFIEVANSEANPVYLANEAFTPTLGVATYLTITLPADGKPIGDPPPEIRKIAMPS